MCELPDIPLRIARPVSLHLPVHLAAASPQHPLADNHPSPRQLLGRERAGEIERSSACLHVCFHDQSAGSHRLRSPRSPADGSVGEQVRSQPIVTNRSEIIRSAGNSNLIIYKARTSSLVRLKRSAAFG
ncbi:hypothetical protein EYF80_019221 [Liparis tanakae]|uniref:Uncharacterized protein n=1 Tax=Liparis tanakae TaxID=230148 RepID=A0A4Z2HX92_9TELE|nr:hypothetical protein EYF80_019221 [Liparis tanakae]